MTATHQERASFTRDEMLEAIAALHAAGEFVATADLDDLGKETAADAIGRVGHRLRKEFFPYEDSDTLEHDPTEVELSALTSDLEREMILAALDSNVRSAEAARVAEDRTGRAAQLVVHAQRVREAGQAYVMFPTAAEVSDMWREATSR